MPLYAYRCDSGHEVEVQVPLADFDATGTVACSYCGADARRAVCAPALGGLRAAGGQAWDGEGLWDGRAARAGVAQEMRECIERDRLIVQRHRTRGLGYLRAHEMAAREGMREEVEKLEHGMRVILDDHARRAAHKPEIVMRHKGRTIVKHTTTRRGRRGAESRLVYEAV